MDFNKENDDEIIGWLEEQGAISWDGMADNGEALFKFNLEKVKEIMPDLYAEIMADIDEDLMSLYQDGLVEIEYDENLNVLFRPSEKTQKMIDKLNLPPFQN